MRNASSPIRLAAVWVTISQTTIWYPSSFSRPRTSGTSSALRTVKISSRLPSRSHRVWAVSVMLAKPTMAYRLE